MEILMTMSQRTAILCKMNPKSEKLNLENFIQISRGIAKLLRKVSRSLPSDRLHDVTVLELLSKNTDKLIFFSQLRA